METQPWLGEAWAGGYLSPAEAGQLNASLEEIGRMLNSMMEESDSFYDMPYLVLHEDIVESYSSPAIAH